MPFKHIIHDGFLKDARAIKNIYPKFGEDLKRLRQSLEAKTGANNPNSKDLGGGLFKFYLSITGKPASKSFGARIIYLLITSDEEIWYLMCYDKSDKRDLTHTDKKAIKKLAIEINNISSEERLLKFRSGTLARKRGIKRNG